MRKEPLPRSSPPSAAPRLLGLMIALSCIAACQSPERALSPLRPGSLLLDVASGDGANSDRLKGTIAFHSSRDGTFQIYLMNPDGSGQHRLLPNNGQYQFDPTWSPDGKQIAFNQFPADFSTGASIFLRDVNGRLTQLSDGTTGDFCCAWSPDGTQIAFRSNRDGADDVYLMNLATRKVTRLTTNAYVANVASWSPDGRHIAFISYRSFVGLGLFMIDANGQNEVPLMDNSVDNEGDHASWSPDGTQFLFSSTRDGGQLHIFVMNTASGAITQLTFPDAQNLSHEDDPTWSPDGEYIAFQGTRDGDEDVYLMNLRTRETGKLTLDGDNSGIFDAVPVWTRRNVQRPF